MIKIKGIYKIIYCVFFHIFVILSNGNKFIQNVYIAVDMELKGRIREAIMKMILKFDIKIE